jgi:choline dehydrogenase-like flavoprotein
VPRIVVVGSGVSGAHAALTLLERGLEVELWDIGEEEPPFPEPELSFGELKEHLPDPVGYFLGRDLEALVPPTAQELLRYPPSRRFMVSGAGLDEFIDHGFSPYGSRAKGGLANGWGANALAFDDGDLVGWPISFADLEPAYRTVAARVPVAGPVDDDLTAHLQGVYPSQPPVRLASNDERLLNAYQRRRGRLRGLGVKMGRARLAVITDPARPDACDYSGRCLWGCARGAIYNPRLSTLRRCESHPGFRYVSGRQVLALRPRDGRIDAIRFVDTASRVIREEPCDAVFLAAGALQTGAIFLRTIGEASGELRPRTDGLMDTTVVRVPFVALSSIGRAEDSRSFQLNRLIAAVVTDSPPWPRYLHIEILHLGSLLYHSLIERLPFDTRTSSRLFFALKSALGVATLFFPDRITSGNHARLVPDADAAPQVELCYHESAEKEQFMRRSVARVRSALHRLGCITQGAIRAGPGAGIHYAGTVPMGEGPNRCDARGRSQRFSNLYIADGAAFPSLPSKSITMSLAAHATRVASLASL